MNPDLSQLDLAPRKRIGLVAHDNKKQDLIEWARYNRPMLEMHDLVATGTTGQMLQRELDLPIAVVWNIPVACDRASADFMISSPLMTGSYARRVPDYTAHNEREVPLPEGIEDAEGFGGAD